MAPPRACPRSGSRGYSSLFHSCVTALPSGPGCARARPERSPGVRSHMAIGLTCVAWGRWGHWRVALCSVGDRGPGPPPPPAPRARRAPRRGRRSRVLEHELLYTYRVARYRAHTLMLASVLPTASPIASPPRPRRSHTGRGPCPNPNPNRRSPSARPPSSPRSHPPDARHAARHAGLRRLVDLPRCRLVVAAAWSYRCRW